LISALYSTIITTSTDSNEPKTRTHNLHSEILLGLSLGTNITDSIRRHGIANDSTRVLVVRIGGQQSAEEVWEGMKGLVEGQVASLGELDEGTGVDWARVDKVSQCVISVRLNELITGV
jgi:EKC/KEOPS complex subunit CGI121/TPRKB